ncbi:Spleen trypsin inhibitor I [Galemys pyrenaicus]|uniref:Spleen trypsin inhibitor I n=1 Tax=Galemys pyrenaicus TaxID=202257 RepID=A0A8J6DT08_GALPY|nr:Spleen trypsin inhibitor I [Galemys pyrenaicus]
MYFTRSLGNCKNETVGEVLLLGCEAPEQMQKAWELLKSLPPQGSSGAVRQASKMSPLSLSTVPLLLLTTLLAATHCDGTSTPGLARPAFCLEPPFTGPCKAKLIRWFFNPSSGRCERFVYGGCKGKKNNFLHEEQCYSTCMKNEMESTVESENTSQDPVPGEGELAPGAEELAPARKEPAPEGEEPAPVEEKAPEEEEPVLEEEEPEERAWEAVASALQEAQQIFEEPAFAE